MKLIRAARLAGIAALAAGIYSLLVLRPFYLKSVQAHEASQLALDSIWQWRLGGWLWLLAIFAWMILLVALMHYYSPVHRISSMLQSGLVVVAATLLIISVLTGMNLFGLTRILSDGHPVARLEIYQNLVEQFAMTFLGAGLLMGGGVTTWICIDLVILDKLPTSWMVPGAVAGVLSLLSPFVLPVLMHLLVANLAYFVWCSILGLRVSLPAAYPDFN